MTFLNHWENLQCMYYDTVYKFNILNHTNPHWLSQSLTSDKGLISHRRACNDLPVNRELPPWCHLYHVTSLHQIHRYLLFSDTWREIYSLILQTSHATQHTHQSTPFSIQIHARGAQPCSCRLTFTAVLLACQSFCVFGFAGMSLEDFLFFHRSQGVHFEKTNCDTSTVNKKADIKTKTAHHVKKVADPRYQLYLKYPIHLWAPLKYDLFLAKSSYNDFK